MAVPQSVVMVGFQGPQSPEKTWQIYCAKNGHWTSVDSGIPIDVTVALQVSLTGDVWLTTRLGHRFHVKLHEGEIPCETTKQP